MLAFLSRYKIQIVVGIGTILYIILVPITRHSSLGDASSFRSLFGQYALISYLLYLGLSTFFRKIVRKFELQNAFACIAHVFAFVIGYSLLAWALHSVATSGIPW